ncbi:MAG: HD domain-containing protein [Candidatus Omnitrophica bacterium]|nr:HD domain-containing protein [Candidatus Omnitrophota bacterium]MCB9747704.1 HD domain-containing protein [Candidatus Omnitrophota bacterium]
MSTKNSSTPIKKYRLILSAVHMVYRLINSTYNVQELILRLTRLLCQFIKADSSVVYLLDPAKQKVFLKASFDNKINILIKKKKELSKVTPEIDRALKGYTVFQNDIIGIPLVADEIVGAIFVMRKEADPFTEFDKEILSVVAEQSVTAIKNLQLYEEQQKVILGSIEFIGKLLEQHGHASAIKHTPVYFKIVKSLAEKLNMVQDEIDSLFYASILRDAGAIDVPYNILAKTSHLTPEEFKVIRQQPTRSAELIRPVEFLKPVLPIILYHHENYDGTGYPSGLKKEQIPLGARIMSVVNAFEAMTRERPYKNRLSVTDAILELKKNSGTQFDPKVVHAFVELSKLKNFRKCLSSPDE